MSTYDIEKKVVTIIAQHIEKDPSSLIPAMSLQDLGCDEFDIIALVMKMEDQCSVLIEDEEMDQIVTVQDAIRIVAAKKAH